MERIMQAGNAEALEEMIRSASEARAGWQIGGTRS
jgi:prephenate dehydrogenase